MPDYFTAWMGVLQPGADIVQNASAAFVFISRPILPG
jgi:hypothetical protein